MTLRLLPIPFVLSSLLFLLLLPPLLALTSQLRKRTGSRRVRVGVEGEEEGEEEIGEEEVGGQGKRDEEGQRARIHLPIIALASIVSLALLFTLHEELTGRKIFSLTRWGSGEGVKNPKAACTPVDGTRLLGAYGSMGGRSRAITTTNSDVQGLFDQGLIHCYGFNQEEGLRNFRAGLKIERDCHMCAWGEAYAMGPVR